MANSVRSVLTAVLALALAPSAAHAEQLPYAGSLFDTYYNAARQQVTRDLPHDESVKFIVRTVSDRYEDFDITEADLRHALNADFKSLCADPVRKLGGLTACQDFGEDIIALIEQEREVQQLGDELMAIANGNELTVADEMHRPLSVAPAAVMFSSIWAGTGTTVLPWPDTEEMEDAMDALEGALGAESSVRDQVIMRFHFGLFRAQREQDAGVMSGFDVCGPAENEPCGEQTREALETIAEILDIDDENASNLRLREYATPKLGGNIALWAREDDIGLHYVYPTHLPRFAIKPADESYPWHYQSGASLDVGYTLAYPFRYRGYLPLVPAGTRSPVCARVSGRNGYLCRAIEEEREVCNEDEEEEEESGDAIVIRTCKEKKERIEMGPAICEGEAFTELFTLEHPSQSGGYGVNRVCVPRTETRFSGTLVSTACYVGWCAKESLSGHTLIGGRNPVVPGEPSQPYLSCMREDPKLGVLAEMPPISTSVIPQYLGADLVRAYEHAYCAITGQVPSHGGVTGLCRYTQERRMALPLHTIFDTAVQALVENGQVEEAQKFLAEIAAPSGQRAAMDQSLPAVGRLARGMAQTIQAIADLFAELEEAPLTTMACPWNGVIDEDKCGTQTSSTPASTP